MAPEIIENKNHGKEVDIYSLGVILYQMVFGEFPYKLNTDSEKLMLRMIKTVPLNFERKGIIIS